MYKDLIIKVGKAQGLLRNQLAYVLATADWETNHTLEPVREAYYLGDKADAYRLKLRYYPYYGRGFVQLTWDFNYKKASDYFNDRLGMKVDFVKRPDDVMIPEYSALILVVGMKEGWFTGKKLSDYITLKTSGFVNARRIVNGTDKAKDIAELAVKYDAQLKKAGYGVEGPLGATAEPADGSGVSTGGVGSPTKTKGFLELLIELIVKLFKRS